MLRGLDPMWVDPSSPHPYAKRVKRAVTKPVVKIEKEPGDSESQAIEVFSDVDSSPGKIPSDYEEYDYDGGMCSSPRELDATELPHERTHTARVIDLSYSPRR